MTTTVVEFRRKVGRSRKVGVPRDANGRISWGHDRETPEQAKATALDARVRQALGVDEWLAKKGDPKAAKAARKKMDDPLRGYALGRLLLTGRTDEALGISQEQHDAGLFFISLYKANARVRGWPSPNARSPGADMVSGGLSCHAEDSEQWVMDIRKRWGDVYRAIYDVGQGEVFEALKRVLIEDLSPTTVEEIGALRVGLNAISHGRR